MSNEELLIQEVQDLKMEIEILKQEIKIARSRLEDRITSSIKKKEEFEAENQNSHLSSAGYEQKGRCAGIISALIVVQDVQLENLENRKYRERAIKQVLEERRKGRQQIIKNTDITVEY